MSTLSKRTRDGCWTCKERRRKCDGARPICDNCRRSERECGGFEVRLRWNAGIASRGKFTGAIQPTHEHARKKPNGRLRDLRRESRKGQADVQDSLPPTDNASATAGTSEINETTTEENTPQSPHNQSPVHSPNEAALLQDFLSSGINVLHASQDDIADPAIPILAANLPQLCRVSPALHSVCVALQATIAHMERSQTLAYLDTALGRFRHELAQSSECLNDATWTAGLLLCSTNILLGLPWTVHLQGMEQIMRFIGLEAASGMQSVFQTHLMEVMGVMDLPFFTLGRQTSSVGVWSHNCLPKGYLRHDRDRVEVMSGLPRSLIDSISRLDQCGSELSFWNWPGVVGSPMQTHLWEAYRLSCVLTIRQYHAGIRSAYQTESFPQHDSGAMPDIEHGPKAPPSTLVLVSRVISCLDGVLRTFEHSSEPRVSPINAILFPAAVVGIEARIVNCHPEWKEIVRSCLDTAGLPHLGNQSALMLQFFEEIWLLEDDSLDVDAMLRSRGLELSLL